MPGVVGTADCAGSAAEVCGAEVGAGVEVCGAGVGVLASEKVMVLVCGLVGEGGWDVILEADREGGEEGFEAWELKG